MSKRSSTTPQRLTAKQRVLKKWPKAMALQIGQHLCVLGRHWFVEPFPFAKKMISGKNATANADWSATP